jgi:hypothetical protein
MATPTPNLGLARPDDGDQNWGGAYRTAMDTLDKSALCFVQPTAPTPAPPHYLWVQTGLGATGTDFTIWVEDGT